VIDNRDLQGIGIVLIIIAVITALCLLLTGCGVPRAADRVSVAVDLVSPPLADTLTQTARLVSNSADVVVTFKTLGPTLEDATRNIASAVSNASAAATERVQQSTTNSKQRQEWMGQLWPYILSALSGTALAMAARAADHRKKAKEKKV
jgi:hypothetical protein